jgi:uncharacterized SAM-binding protein YcdF (DUF218 family)
VRPLRWFRRLVALAVLLPLLVVGGTAAGVWWTARQDDRPPSDAIVVLGASQYDGRPSSVFEARLEHAKRLYDAGVAERVVTVGGGAPGDRTTEAQAGARYLEQRGVEVVAVPEGRDTLESLQAVDRLFDERGWSSAVVVTDPWHSLRSRTMARDLGPAGRDLADAVGAVGAHPRHAGALHRARDRGLPVLPAAVAQQRRRTARRLTATTMCDPQHQGAGDSASRPGKTGCARGGVRRTVAADRPPGPRRGRRTSWL